jgi:hypothetical protein
MAPVGVVSSTQTTSLPGVGVGDGVGVGVGVGIGVGVGVGIGVGVGVGVGPPVIVSVTGNTAELLFDVTCTLPE